MKQQIKALCELDAPSGFEQEVREYILTQLNDRCSCTIDAIGNLIVTHKGLEPAQTLALFAHMDEVSVMITQITSEGLLKCSPIGMDGMALFGKKLSIGERKVIGAVGAKAWHHLETAERDAAIKQENIYIDIGAINKSEAEQAVGVGDYGVFCAPFVSLSDDMICAKALDNRIGCAILIELLNSDFPYAFTGVFTCCEESGLLGATAAAYTVQPDVAIILETTTAGDIEGTPQNKVVCLLEKGAVVSFADKGSLYDRALFSLAFSLAKQQNIPLQTKEGVYGGNEARAIAASGRGVRVCAVSTPCRYLHSASSIASMKDVASSLAITRALMTELLHV